MNDFTMRDHARQASAFIVKALGEDWSVDTEGTSGFQDGRVYIDGPNQARLLLAFGGIYGRTSDRDRLEVRGVTPVSAPRHTLTYELSEQKHQIGMSRDKTPEQIAREITRRLLPDYMPYVQQCLLSAARHRDDTTARSETLAALASAFPHGVARNENQVYTHGPDHTWYGDLRVNNDGSRLAELTLRSISIEQALKIAEVLR